ncbi:MAG: hypothetical protein IJY25_00470 [Bacilli bacterium]|nr:hypothetical protein [Bacilli bacterium]
MKDIKYLENNIDILNLDDIVTKRLKSISIYKVEDLWKCKRNYLKENDFTNNDISQIKIKLQLIGLDLNKKKY